LPLPMQDSLPAGWLAFTGRELNPLDRDERFPSCYISSPLPGLVLTLRHFIGGLLALASLNHACRALVPAFLQRSPPLLLAIAACSGLRPAPDCRPRRALLHLSYSCEPPDTQDDLVTHGTFSPSKLRETAEALRKPTKRAPCLWRPFGQRHRLAVQECGRTIALPEILAIPPSRR
jgi:hypothetical protein